MLTLYYAPRSCSTASHIVLEEMGAPYRAVKVDFAIAEQRSPEFLRLNPKGKVPVLVDGDAVFTENVAIQYHLVVTHPEARLWPDDHEGRVRWLSFIAWLANSVQPDARHITRPENYTDDPSNHPALQAKGRATTAKWMRTLDDTLATSRWMLGERYTTADPYALVFAGVAERFDVPIGSYTNLVGWVRRMLERAPVRRILELEDSALLRFAPAGAGNR
jgi:glutathione S-transferase